MTASIVYLNNVRLETGFAKDHHERILKPHAIL